MNQPFFLGLSFAAGEQAASAALEYLEEWDPGRILDEIVQNIPKFLAFGFLAGVLADWLLVKGQNQGPKILISLLICASVLLFTWLIKKNASFLGKAFDKDPLRGWHVRVVVCCLGNLLLALSPYLLFHEVLGVAPRVTAIVSLGVVIAYCCVAIRRQCCLIEARSSASAAQIRSLLELYCRTAPDENAKVSVSPESHMGQDLRYFQGRLNNWIPVYDAAHQCCCLETQLVNLIGKSKGLPNKQCFAVVRSTIKQYTLEIMHERKALEVIVLDNPAEPVDALEKAGKTELLQKLQELRASARRTGPGVP